MIFIGTAGSRGIFSSRGDASRFSFVLLFIPRKEAVSSVKKTSAILKKAMTDGHARWPKKECKNKAKPHWRPPAGRGEEGGQSSHDKWTSSKPQGKWKAISAEIDTLRTTVKEKNEYLEQKLQRQRQERIGITQHGCTNSHRRKARAQSKKRG